MKNPPAGRLADPIAIFDSGVGGLSVLRHIRALLPGENLLYLADQANVPYGPRPAGEVCQFTAAITRFLLAQQAKLIVVACNTATAAALTYLRDTFPHISFVGMEPAVKPGAQQTQTGKVGVLATAGTFESQRYASLMARYAQHVTLYEDPCVGLVELIEAGELASPATTALLQRCLAPMLQAGVDTIVLGCTHYPFVLPLLTTLTEPGRVSIIDPAPAVARQVQRLLLAQQLAAPQTAPGHLHAFTSADPGRLTHQIQTLLGETIPVTPLSWQAGELRPR